MTKAAKQEEAEMGRTAVRGAHTFFAQIHLAVETLRGLASEGHSEFAENLRLPLKTYMDAYESIDPKSGKLKRGSKDLPKATSGEPVTIRDVVATMRTAHLQAAEIIRARAEPLKIQEAYALEKMVMPSTYCRRLGDNPIEGTRQQPSPTVPELQVPTGVRLSAPALMAFLNGSKLVAG